MNSRFNRERVRFHTKKKNTLVVQGWFEDGERDPECFKAQLGGQRIPLTARVQQGVEVTRKYLRYKTNVTAEYFLMAELPGRTARELDGRTLRIWYACGEKKNAAAGFSGRNRTASKTECSIEGEERVKTEESGEAWADSKDRKTGEAESGKPQLIFRFSARQIERLSHRLESWAETLQELPDGRYRLRGWYMGASQARIAVLDFHGRELPSECTLTQRLDVLGEFPEASLEETHGFEVTFDRPKDRYLRLALKGAGRRALYLIDCDKMLSGREDLANLARKSFLYLRRKGVKQFVRRVSDAALGNNSVSYDHWRKKYGVKSAELKWQRQTHYAREPKISIVVPLYRTPEKFLRRMISSVEAQTYANWELVLSDGSGDPALTPLLKEYEKKDARIRPLYAADTPLRIAPNTNRALAAATGEYLVFGDHDDLFSPDALAECVKALQEHPDAELIYSDEDKVDASGRRYFEPHFKSDYNPELLCSMNYFCHLVLVGRGLLARTGGLNESFDGAQDYDFVLRCTEQTDASRIVHIPKVLYHWRSHGDSTAENPESKRYAFEAGRRAVAAHYERLGIEAEVEEGEYPGLYHTKFVIRKKENGTLPLISILIPNKDHIADLKKCVRSVTGQSRYRNYEILVIENNSTEPETFAAYQELEGEIPELRVLYYKGSFNFSAINNFGAEQAKGDYLLLLNNDTEMIGGDCLGQMLGYCQLPGVGAVGALLFYEDNTIQHAGVVLGYGGIAGHAFIGSRRGENGYFSRILCAQDYSAVTAACMMVKADAYREVGGMTEELRVAFNDIDFCMKLREAGYRIVYNPGAQLYHYESKSRGLENTQEKIERFNGEIALFLKRWGRLVEAGDPYYSPNLSLDKADFSLRT